MGLIWHTVLFLWLFKELACQQTFQDKSNTTGTEEVDTTQGYVVWNPLCRIPRFDSYDNSIKEYLIPVRKPKICSHLDPLTTVEFNSTIQRHTLMVNPNVVRKYWSTVSALRCCYTEISRNRKSKNDISDTKYNQSQAVCFKNHTELPPKAETIFVYCTSKNRKIFKTVYLIPANKTEDKKPKQINLKSAANKKNYSVLLFGIGSMSRSNFVRTLPETKKFIEEHGWLPLEGYVKVGDDTFSNLVPILMGRSVDQLTKVCHFDKKLELDKCPFIWKNFSENGYLTSFTENSVSTFNQDKYKFFNSPTDFHSQPFLSAAEDLLRKKNDTDDYCLGQRPKIEYLFDFNAKFLQRFHKRPYFNLFWLNSLDQANTSTSIDDLVTTFFKDIEPYLNSTMVIFFGDHGQRFGNIRQTFVGWVEEQMPFLYFHLPPSLKSSNSNWYQNLLGNRNKLISPFDLHATLQKLVFGRVLSPLAGCSKCGSLFAPVPNNRTCSNAAIPPTCCTCWPSNSSNSVSNPRATVPARQAIVTINAYLRGKADKVKRGYRCAPLSFGQVTKVHSESANGTSRNTVVFETKPKKAVFEITIPQDIVAVEKVEEIRRIDKANETSCVKNDNLLKTFCSCIKK